MKCVFNKTAALFLLTLVSASTAASGHARVYYSVRGLLAEQFQESDRVDYKRVQLSDEQRSQLQARLGTKIERDEYIIYVAHSAADIDGYALFDREIGQHEYIDLATFFDSEGKVTRVEVVAYREPYGAGIRSERFRRQFVGKVASSDLKPGYDIDVISGATLSTRAMAKAVKRASVLVHDMVLTSP